jgi:hypothetical protein
MKYSVNREYFSLNSSDEIHSNITCYVKYIYVKQIINLLIK